MVIIERFVNTAKGLKITGKTHALSRNSTEIFKATGTKRPGGETSAAAPGRLGAESMRTWDATDRRKPQLTPHGVSASTWTYSGTPKKAQALPEVGGAENREHSDPLIPSPGRQTTLCPDLGTED